MDELKGFIDFWMSYRTGDNATMFSHLGIDEDRVLKCFAHIILGIDNAADSKFRIAEQKIGVQKLLNVSAGQKAFCSPNTSIHTLGQIALSKLLSPSHVAHSISLFSSIHSTVDEGKRS